MKIPQMEQASASRRSQNESLIDRLLVSNVNIQDEGVARKSDLARSMTFNQDDD